MLNKKILSISFILLAALLIAGCSDNNATNTFSEKITILDGSNNLIPEESIIEQSNNKVTEECISCDTTESFADEKTQDVISTESIDEIHVGGIEKDEFIVDETVINETIEETPSITIQEQEIFPDITVPGKTEDMTGTTEIIEKEDIIIPEETTRFEDEKAIQNTTSENPSSKAEAPVIQEEPQRALPKNPTIIMDKIVSVEEFLCAPSESDFGDNYDKAVNLYNAILNKQAEIEIYFDTDWEDMKKFINKFEERVMHNLFVITKTTVSGGKNYIQCWPASIYDEILEFNDYRDIIISLGIDEYIDKKDAVIKINNWIIDYLTYEISQNDAHLAFINKKANCDGYARLFQRFCKVIDVECTWESGRVKSDGAYGLHAWNKVKLDNVWYYIDVCWNDSTSRNRYLLSEKLWYNHTSMVNVDIVAPSDKDWGNNVYFKNDISINDILTEPTQDVFGINYEAAMNIYKGILNDEKYVGVELFKEINDIDSYSAYDAFAAKFKKYVLNSSMDLQYSSIGWLVNRECDVKLTANTYGMRKQLLSSIDGFEEYHKANIAAGVQDGMTEMEAVVKILNWMTRNLEYDNYASKNSVGALITGKADYRWYAEIFYYMCKNIGIDCEIINGRHIPDGRRVAALWNKVKIGETWYYTDLWYYSITSYKDAEKLEYFLSEELWENHITDISVNG